MRFEPSKYFLTLWNKISEPVIAKAFAELVDKQNKAYADLKADMLEMQTSSGSGFVPPAGMTVFFLTAACPVGWAEATEMRGRFPRGKDTGDTAGDIGGSSTHTHTGSTSDGITGTNIQNGTGVTVNVAPRLHNHNVTINSASSLPPYVNGIWCKYNA